MGNLKIPRSGTTTISTTGEVGSGVRAGQPQAASTQAAIPDAPSSLRKSDPRILAMQPKQEPKAHGAVGERGLVAGKLDTAWNELSPAHQQLVLAVAKHASDDRLATAVDEALWSLYYQTDPRTDALMRQALQAGSDAKLDALDWASRFVG